LKKISLLPRKTITIVLILMVAGFGTLAIVDRTRASGAFASLFAGAPPTMISYQGIVNVNVTPFTGTGHFKFAIVDAASGNGSTNYWANDGQANGEPATAVPLTVNSGLFNVLLGDTSLSGMSQTLSENAFSETATYLRVWFSQSASGPFEALEPNQRITAVAYALRAKYADNSAPGPVGPAGPVGPQGPAGPAGPDPLAGVTCSAGQLLQWNGSAWVCVNNIKLGENPTTCDSAAQGTLRWNNRVEVCANGVWGVVRVGHDAILYEGGIYLGTMGGRVGADNLCANSSNKPSGYLNYHAFLSVSATDEIRDMPANYDVASELAIRSPNGTLIANDWLDLLDGSINARLGDIGVLSGGGSNWWSGSDADGSIADSGSTCSGWTGGNYGRVGSGWITNAWWMATPSDSYVCTVDPAVLLCLAY